MSIDSTTRAVVEPRLRNLFKERLVLAAESKNQDSIYGRDLWPITLLWQKANDTPYPADFIVWPETEKEIIDLISICREYKIPLVPYAGGSGVCGGTVPVYGGIICDVKRVDKIIELNEKNLTCTVEPGMNGQLFEEYLNRHGYTLGHFPSSIYVSTVGGWVATRAAGQLSTYYGKIEDMVLNLKMVLGNGETVETLPSPASAQGPDFNQIFIGSEGVLGIITSVTFKIHVYPKKRGFFAVKAKDVTQGIEFMRQVMREELKPAAVRLYDELDTAIIGSPEEKNDSNSESGTGYKAILKSLKEGKGLTTILRFAGLTNRAANIGLKFLNAGCLLLFTFEGPEELVATQLHLIEKLALDNQLDIKGEKPAEYWWNHRYDVSYNSPSVIKAGAFLDTCEVATTWDKLADLYFNVKNAVQDEVFIMAHFSHSYLNGNNIYFSIVGFADSYEESKKKYFRVWDKMMKVCLDMNVAISHHHSIGLLKQEYLKKQLGNKLPIWKSIKQACDPDNIMNPGKMGV